MINRLRGGELISHAGHVNTAIHQVQKENNNRTEAVKKKPLTTCNAENHNSVLLQSLGSGKLQIQDKERRFSGEETYNDEAGQPGDLYWAEGET